MAMRKGTYLARDESKYRSREEARGNSACRLKTVHHLSQLMDELASFLVVASPHRIEDLLVTEVLPPLNIRRRNLKRIPWLFTIFWPHSTSGFLPPRARYKSGQAQRCSFHNLFPSAVSCFDRMPVSAS